MSQKKKKLELPKKEEKTSGTPPFLPPHIPHLCCCVALRLLLLLLRRPTTAPADDGERRQRCSSPTHRGIRNHVPVLGPPASLRTRPRPIDLGSGSWDGRSTDNPDSYHPPSRPPGWQISASFQLLL